MNISEALMHLSELEELETRIRNLHDTVCGENMYLGGKDTGVTNDVFHGIQDTLFTELGEHLAKHCRRTLKRLARKETSQL